MYLAFIKCSRYSGPLRNSVFHLLGTRVSIPQLLSVSDMDATGTRRTRYLRAGMQVSVHQHRARALQHRTLQPSLSTDNSLVMCVLISPLSWLPWWCLGEVSEVQGIKMLYVLTIRESREDGGGGGGGGGGGTVERFG